MIVVIFTSSLRFPSRYMLYMFVCRLYDSETERVTGLVVVFLAMAAGEDNRSLSVSRRRRNELTRQIFLPT